MNKKFLAKLLIFCMVFTMLPMAAFAADETTAGGSYVVENDTDITYNVSTDTVFVLNDMLTKPVVTINAIADGAKLSVDNVYITTQDVTITNLQLVVTVEDGKLQFTVAAVAYLTLNNVKAEDAVYIVAQDAVAASAALAAEEETKSNITINGGNFSKDVWILEKGKGSVVEVMSNNLTGKVHIPYGFKGTVILDGKVIEKTTDNVVFESNNDGNYGGGGGSSSNVSIATKVTGGKVTVTPTRPTRGQTVTINVTPNEGYKLDTLVVTDNKGNNVELTKVSDNKYTFVMPAGKVTVTPTFVKTNATDETKDPAAVKRFSDVASGAWYAEYITYVTENALMNGYDDGRFGPNDQTTRAQIVTVLYRLEGEPATRSSNSFSDVSAGGQYYSSAVAWAAINNIVNGYEDGRFGPNDNVTREQIAAILYRYATYKGYDTENAGSIANFSDAAKVSSWANTAISWAVGEGLMNGDNGALRPQGNATRAEIAALLMRFAENIAK